MLRREIEILERQLEANRVAWEQVEKCNVDIEEKKKEIQRLVHIYDRLNQQILERKEIINTYSIIISQMSKKFVQVKKYFPEIKTLLYKQLQSFQWNKKTYSDELIKIQNQIEKTKKQSILEERTLKEKQDENKYLAWEIKKKSNELLLQDTEKEKNNKIITIQKQEIEQNKTQIKDIEEEIYKLSEKYVLNIP